MKFGPLDPPDPTRPPRPAERFGRFLVDRGVVAADVLEATAESQVIFGRRLGTTLLELGHLQEDELERQLSDYLEVPVPPAAWLTPPARDALAAIPARLAGELGALAFRKDDGERGKLHVALLDPQDASALAAIQRASGRRVVAYVLCERRLRDLLERHLGIVQRDRALAVEPLDAGPPAVRVAPPKAEPDRQEAGPDLEALGMVPLPAEDELIDRTTFEKLHEVGTVSLGELGSAAPEGQASPVEPNVLAPPPLSELEASLASATQREQAVEAALRVARRHASATVLFAVGGEAITVIGSSSPERREVAREIPLPASTPSILSSAAASGQAYRGELPRAGADRAVFEALGREGAREAVILPVRIGSRVVNLLYADAGPDPFPATSEAALKVLCELLGQTYARLILAKKRLYR